MLSLFLRIPLSLTMTPQGVSTVSMGARRSSRRHAGRWKDRAGEGAKGAGRRHSWAQERGIEADAGTEFQRLDDEHELISHILKLGAFERVEEKRV
jgi:hypothetical protein